MDRSDLLLLAKELHQTPREAWQRSAASRAYYYVFHLCRDECLSLSDPPDDGRAYGEHWKLIRKLTNYKHPSDQAITRRIVSIGYMLQQLRDIRQRADYDLSATFSSSDTEIMFSQIGEIENKLQTGKQVQDL